MPAVRPSAAQSRLSGIENLTGKTADTRTSRTYARQWRDWAGDPKRLGPSYLLRGFIDTDRSSGITISDDPTPMDFGSCYLCES